MTTPNGSTNINTGGGDFAGRDIDKRQGVFNTYTEDTRYDVRGLESPYLGLRSYSYAERDRFAGRERSLGEAASKLTEGSGHRGLLFVTGVSGSGKSSFVKAGLVPKLEEYYTTTYGAQVRRADFRPAAAPIDQLTRALRELTKNLSLAFDTPTPEAILECLRVHTPDNAVNLLVIDQFEELFTQAERAAPDQFAALIALLEQLPAFEQLRTHVIATIRADFLPELFAHQALFQIVKDGVELRKMTVDELKNAIRQPLRASLIASNQAADSKGFEPALLDQLANDAAQDASYLPLLQVTLDELWRGGSLRLSAYLPANPDEPPSLAHALQRWADSVYQYADFAAAEPSQPRDQEDQRELMALLLDLVEVDDGNDARRDVRCRQTYSALARGSERRARLIEELCESRLLARPFAGGQSGGADADADVVDIIHEALIRTWKPLQDAIRDQRQLLRQRRRFRQALDVWRQAAPEQKNAALLTGVQLAEAQELAQRGAIEFASGEAQQLLRLSIAQREQEQRQRILPIVAHSLALSAVREQTFFSLDERAALLARQAYLFGAAIQTPLQDPSTEELRTVLSKAYFSRILEHAYVISVAFGADGSALFTGDKGGLSWRWDIDNPSTPPSASEASVKGSLALDWSVFSGDGYTYATMDSAGLWVSNVYEPTARPIFFSTIFNTDSKMALDHNGKTLVAALADGKLVLWDLRRPDDAPLQLADDFTCYSLAFSLDARTLAAVTKDGELRLWDLRNPTAPPAIFQGQPDSTMIDGAPPSAPAFSLDGNVLAMSPWMGGIYIRDLRKPAADIIASFTLPGHHVTALAFNPDGQTLAAGADDGTLQLLDLREPTAPPITLTGHRSSIATLVFSPRGDMLASGSADRTVRLWRLRAAIEPETTVSGMRLTGNVALTPDGARFAHAETGAYVRVWNLQEPSAPSIQTPEHSEGITALAFSPDGQTLASGSSDRKVWLWNLERLDADPLILRGHTGQLRSLAFSPDGQRLASSSNGWSIYVWDLTALDRAPTVLTAHNDHVLSVAWNPSGQQLVSSSDDGTGRVWDMATPDAQPRTISPGGLDRMLFSPDGGTLAGYVHGGKQISLWNVGQLEAPPVEIPIDEGTITSLCFSLDGEIMAVGLDNGSVKLWSVRQPKTPPRTLFGCRSPVRALFFSPNGIMLSAYEEHGIVQRWWLSGSWLADLVCRLVGRNLTHDEWQRFVGEAIPYERTCLNLPLHPSVLEAGDRLAEALDYEGAVAIFRRALELDPQLGLIPELRAHEAVARARLAAGDLPGALADLEQARAVVPAGDANHIAEIDGWIAALQAGRNPFLEGDAALAQPGAEQ